MTVLVHEVHVVLGDHCLSLYMCNYRYTTMLNFVLPAVCSELHLHVPSKNEMLSSL